MATIYKADGAQTDVQPKNGTDFNLEELQAIVGGYIEIIRIGGNRIMVLNEEGNLIGLSYNEQASRLAGSYAPIVGDVLVCDDEQVR